jgi:glycine/D-amino acid oxidase-like deaminating enzyme/nitrite reductase/ring-hydroxylating ferredoxin subunit
MTSSPGDETTARTGPAAAGSEPGSIWWRERALPSFPPLAEELSVDSVIAGGGWTGLLLAVRLAEAGQTVAVVERRRIGSGTTGCSTAHLTAALDVPWETVISRFGEDAARTLAAAVGRAIDGLQLASRHAAGGAGFARVPGFRFATDEQAQAELDREEDACGRIGVEARRVDAGSPALAALRARGALRYERQAEIDPVAQLEALARRFVELGGQIFEQSPVVATDKQGLETAKGRVRARAVVHATHTPIGIAASVQTRVVPFASYVLAARLAQPFEAALFWDCEDPYHYVRSVAPDRRLVLVGGGDHRVGRCGDPAERHRDLERWARERLGPLAVEARWSAELFESADGLPFVGRLPGSRAQYVAAGFAGTGLTFGAVSAELLADLLLRGESPLAGLLAPGRLGPLAGAVEAGRENLGIAWRLVRDHACALAAPRTTSDLPPDSGRVVAKGGRPLALYRDPGGELHVLSARCTHLGCVVQWNDLEKTWDCPCHGGRFARTGKVLYGPPAHDLERVDEEP